MKELLALMSEIFCYRRDMAQMQEEIKDLRAQVNDLTALLRELAYEVRADRQATQHERENLELRLELALTRANRQLPPPDDQS